MSSLAMSDVFTAIATGVANGNAHLQRDMLGDERTIKEIADVRFETCEDNLVKVYATVKHFGYDLPKSQVMKIKARRDTNDAIDLQVAG